jgi:nucleoside-diphosphate-sugar epimerase
VSGQHGAVVTGAGGFIGGHLVPALLDRGLRVRGIDIKPFAQWHQLHRGAENIVADLSDRTTCAASIDPGAFVFNLAADMGGMGFIARNDIACLSTSEVSFNVLRAAADAGAAGYLFTSSACVYPAYRQRPGRLDGLAEAEAYPASPPEGYGWEKLFAERTAQAYSAERGLSIRLPRLHNVYGSKGTWRGGREKAPAAIARKVVMARVAGVQKVPLWGDGTAVRSFLHVHDCIDGLVRLAFESQFPDPVNIGSDDPLSVEELFGLVCELAGADLTPDWQPGPVGVQSRNADISLAASTLGWRPTTTLRVGMAELVREIESIIEAVPRRDVVEAIRDGAWDL